MIKHGKNVPPTLGRTVKEASAICRSFIDGVVIFKLWLDLFDFVWITQLCTNFALVSIFFDSQQNKNCFKVLSLHGTKLWMPYFLIILFFGTSVMLTVDSKKWQILGQYASSWLLPVLWNIPRIERNGSLWMFQECFNVSWKYKVCLKKIFQEYFKDASWGGLYSWYNLTWWELSKCWLMITKKS